MTILLMIEFIYVLILSNVAAISVAIYYWRKSRIQVERKESVELQEFLGDLLTGGSLIHVKRIAPADALIHVRHKR